MKIWLNKETSMDLLQLIVSRLLIQANSGGGKSWAIRRIIEMAFGHVQIIVIDPEGEFGNLRSKFDFVYAGKGGDAPVETRSAALLARRLLELKASAIIDLYEVPPQERKHFVRLFLEAMVNSPKELWHDCLVILDEAHVFAPEKNQSESLGAVIDMASRGRKRGFCLIPATQRPAKLNKDVAAECNNKLIGRASLDIDRKRSAEELGFTTREEVLSLRNLEPGEFYAFGPAISREVIRVMIGEVQVKPAKRGVSKQSVPAPSAHVKKMLAKLADLPKEAEQEAKTVAELKAEIAVLKRAKPVESNLPMGVSQWMMYGEKYGYHDFFAKKILKARDEEWRPKLDFAVRELKRFGKIFTVIGDLIGAEKVNQVPDIEMPSMPTKSIQPVPMPGRDVSNHAPISPKVPQSGLMSENATKDVPFEGITGPEQRILDAIALSESIGITEPLQTAVAFLAGYTYGGGGFNNPRGALKTKGFLEYRDNKLALTEAGRAFANKPDAPLTKETMREKVMSILPGPEKRLLGPLMDAHPLAMANEDLRIAAHYEPGGGFNNPRGRLKSLGLIDYPSAGFTRANDILFP